jgi:hypothetical protein
VAAAFVVVDEVEEEDEDGVDDEEEEDDDEDEDDESLEADVVSGFLVVEGSAPAAFSAPALAERESLR